jgi:diacylglycerol kinase (ATP)
LPRYIVYIINPISGKGKGLSLQKKIESMTSAAGLEYDIISSRENGDYRFLEKYNIERKVTDIVIAGGDGTVSQVIGSLPVTDLNFGIIPCGSGNGLALAARIPRDPEKALRLVLDGHTQKTDGFLVNNRFACMLCGLGFDAQVAHDFAHQSKRGLYTYVRQVLKNFFSARTSHFDVIIDDKVLHTDAFFISVANSNQFGNHFTIAPRASLDDGLLDVVIVTGQNKLSLLWQTYRQIRGINKLQHTAVIEQRRGVIYFQATSLRIINHDKAPLHIDGDPAVTTGVLDFSILRHHFNLYKPEATQ